MRRVEAEVEVEVDIDVEVLRHAEDARDLAVRVLVHVGRATHHVGALVERLSHHVLAAGIVEKAFLREDAELHVDGP
jgi:hypothetical protein